MNRRLHESRYFRLQQETNRHNGRRYYRIVLWNYAMSVEDVLDARDMIDPHRNKSGKYGCDWKFKSRVEAERMYTALIMRWS